MHGFLCQSVLDFSRLLVFLSVVGVRLKHHGEWRIQNSGFPLDFRNNISSQIFQDVSLIMLWNNEKAREGGSGWVKLQVILIIVTFISLYSAFHF